MAAAGYFTPQSGETWEHIKNHYTSVFRKYYMDYIAEKVAEELNIDTALAKEMLIESLDNFEKKPTEEQISEISVLGHNYRFHDLYSVGEEKQITNIPHDIANFIMDIDNYSLIRVIIKMKLEGHSNEVIEEWLNSLKNTLKAMAKQHNLSPGKVSWTEGDTPKDEQEEITNKIEGKIKAKKLKPFHT
jgi:hypothetical protein